MKISEMVGDGLREVAFFSRKSAALKTGGMNRALSLALASLAMLNASCSQASKEQNGPSGGEVTGAPDAHCDGVPAQPTHASACDVTAVPGAGGSDDSDNPYGVTMFGTQGDDDDCKYHVAWTSSAIRRNENVTFTVTATTKFDGSPVIAAQPEVEAFLSDTHPAPNTAQHSTSTSVPGQYAIGPLQFDDSGQWTVRFHFFGDCADVLPDSPHGHAAFWVRVP